MFSLRLYRVWTLLQEVNLSKTVLTRSVTTVVDAVIVSMYVQKGRVNQTDPCATMYKEKTSFNTADGRMDSPALFLIAF
jgi:hypothetical protein